MEEARRNGKKKEVIMDGLICCFLDNRAPEREKKMQKKGSVFKTARDKFLRLNKT